MKNEMNNTESLEFNKHIVTAAVIFGLSFTPFCEYNSSLNHTTSIPIPNNIYEITEETSSNLYYEENQFNFSNSNEFIKRTDFEFILKFAEKIIEESKPLDREFQKILNEKFNELW